MIFVRIILRNTLLLSLPAHSTPPCILCALHGEIFLKSALWERDYLQLYIVQQRYSRHSQWLWIFLKWNWSKKQRSVIGYSKICSLNCPDLIWIQNNPLPFFHGFYRQFVKLLAFLFSKSLQKLWICRKKLFTKGLKMKSGIFRYEDFFHFSDDTYFIHKSPFSAFLLKKRKPSPK